MTDEQKEVVIVGTGNTVSTVSIRTNELLQASRLFAVLSNLDALLLFSLMSDGIEADTSTHSRIGLTRKQYYTRLTQLKNAGLVEKRDTRYFLTNLGSFLHENCINPVMEAARNSKLAESGGHANEEMDAKK